MMDEPCTPEQLLERLRGGDEAAAAALFNRFARRLIGLAHRRLDTGIRQKVDPEDVVQSVFKSFFVHQLEGRFEAGDWGSLWSLLALITVQKCTDARIRFGRQRRNARREVQPAGQGEGAAAGWEALARDPTPAEAVVLTELVEGLIQSLPQRERQIVALSLEGKSLEEISAVVGRAERTVRRTLEQFRQRLEQVVLESGEPS